MKPLPDQSSNSKYGYAGLAIVLLSFPVVYLFQKNGHVKVGLSVGLFAFGTFWSLCGIGQLITGYAWKNLAEGNRGAHRADNPKEFWTAVGICAVGTLASWLLAIVQLFKE